MTNIISVEGDIHSVNCSYTYLPPHPLVNIGQTFLAQLLTNTLCKIFTRKILFYSKLSSFSTEIIQCCSQSKESHWRSWLPFKQFYGIQISPEEWASRKAAFQKSLIILNIFTWLLATKIIQSCAVIASGKSVIFTAGSLLSKSSKVINSGKCNTLCVLFWQKY